MASWIPRALRREGRDCQPNDLQNEHSIVGNNVGLMLIAASRHVRTEERVWIPAIARGPARIRVQASRARSRVGRHAHGDAWRGATVTLVINGEQERGTPAFTSRVRLIFARTSGKAGDGDGITPSSADELAGLQGREILWTFNMPTDHGRIRSPDVRVPNDGDLRRRRTRSAGVQTSSTRTASAGRIEPGAAQFCINESVEYAKVRAPFGKPLSGTRRSSSRWSSCRRSAKMLRALIHKTAWQMDTYGAFSASDKVRCATTGRTGLCCEAATARCRSTAASAIRGTMPFEHIYRHHARYRITEGSEETQLRRRRRVTIVRLHGSSGAPKGVHEESSRRGFRSFRGF
jgi:hypothetical protein